MEALDKKMPDTIENKTHQQEGKEQLKEDIFSIQEINIEEMAIDGICGVY